MLGTPFHPKPCINRSHLANTTSFHTTRTTVPQKKPGSILLSFVQCFTFGSHFTTEFLNASFHSAETRARAVPALCGIFLNLKIFYFSFCLNKKSLAASYFPAKSSIIGVRELDFRVRNGNGYYLSTMATRQKYKIKTKA